MKPTFDFSPLCQAFFSKRLMAQCKASTHTISAYAQTFRLLMAYAQKRLHLPPSKLSLAQLDATFVAEFLEGWNPVGPTARALATLGLHHFVPFTTTPHWKLRSTRV